MESIDPHRCFRIDINELPDIGITRIITPRRKKEMYKNAGDRLQTWRILQCFSFIHPRHHSFFFGIIINSLYRFLFSFNRK